MMEITNPQFWVALLEIIGVNVVLSGDNAVVIALAARMLPVPARKKAIFFGSFAAIVMRIILTVVAVEMLKLRFLKAAGSVLLVWIAVRLLAPEEDGDVAPADNAGNLWAAVRTILLADLVMSLDNVLGVAAAAHGNLVLLIAGLAISIPLIIFGSTVILRLMDRFPVIIVLGAALLGYVAGEMFLTDPAISGFVETMPAWLEHAAPLTTAVMVVTIGKLIERRFLAKRHEVKSPPVDLAIREEADRDYPGGR